MNNKIINILKYSLGWPISVISLFFILRVIFLKSASITSYLANLNFGLIFIGIMFFLFYYFGRGYLWQKMMNIKGYNFRLKEITYIWGTSELKRYTPGNIWSFLARGLLMQKRGISKKDILNSFILEAELILLSSLILTIFSISWIFDLLPSYLNQGVFKNLSVFLILIITFGFIFSAKIKKKIKFFSFLFPDSSPVSNLNLLAISTLSMFFFGLGSYFVASSITPLMFSHVVVFSGLFVFSLLVGYLSVITPMGLGVREGVIIWALLPVISLNLAAAISLLTRIFLMFSELIFLGLIYFWFNLKNKFLLSLEKYISKYRYEAGLGLLILIYITYFSLAGFLRFDNFFAGRFDLGNMDQVVWNTINGRFFQFTDPNGTNVISRLAYHSDFILVLISPLYLIWSSPKALILLQTVVLAFGAIFVYLISRDVLKNKKISLLFSFLYLIYPALQYVNLYDFHGVALVTTFLLGTFYFLIKKRYIWFLIFAILAALTKEEIWLVVLIFGLYLFFLSIKNRIKEKKVFIIGAFLTVVSAVVFYVLVAIATPALRGGEHFALSYYSDFGASPSEIMKNVIFSPHKVVAIITEPKRLEYLYQLFFPTGFLAIFAPFYLVFALPDLLINMLSRNAQLYQIYYQYTSAITPFVFISSIYGVKFLKKRFPIISLDVFFWYLLLTALLSGYLFGPLPGAKHPNINMFVKQVPNKDTIGNFLSGIPASFSIASTNNLGAHLSQREKIYTIPVGINQADIILFLLNDPFAQPSLSAQKEMAENMGKDARFTKIFKDGDFVVFKKNLSIE